MSLANYYQLAQRLVLSNRITAKHIQNRSLSTIDLIHTGGTFSIRGFHEDMFSGNTIIFTNSELRLLMEGNSRVFLFIDYGYVEDNRPNIRTRHADLFGFGLGLRVETRIGLLRIDYGFHYHSGRWLNPVNGIIHFGIETSF
jgi:hemolysin activation/secretion protein